MQYRNAVARDASFGEARFKLAGAYAETGDVKNALREYVRAADLLPKNVDRPTPSRERSPGSGQIHNEAKARAIGGS